jgi:hypothetical protein
MLDMPRKMKDGLKSHNDLVQFGLRSGLHPISRPNGKHYCDRITSKMKGLSPKIISGDSRRSENAQTHTNKHTIPNMKFKLKLLQIKCHVLGFTKGEAQNVLQKIIRVCGSVCLSRQAHALRPRRE